MIFEQLKYFYSAATLSHIGRAAEQENISQPSLSIAIKKLEQELNVPLFQKNGRNIELTPEGRMFLPYAASILQQAEQARNQMKQCSGQFHSQIRLAYTAAVACRYIPELFSAFLEGRDQNCLIFSDEMPSDDIARGLKDGRFDLGICSRIKEDPDLLQIPILHQPLVLIAPCETGSRIRSLSLLNFGDKGIHISMPALCRIPFISYRQDYPMYRQVSSLFDQAGLTPMITSYAYSEDAIARLVEHGLGVSIVAHTDSLDQYRIQILSPSWLTESRDIFLTWNQSHPHGEAVRTMMDFILERSDSLPMPGTRL